MAFLEAEFHALLGGDPCAGNEQGAHESDWVRDGVAVHGGGGRGRAGLRHLCAHGVGGAAAGAGGAAGGVPVPDASGGELGRREGRARGGPPVQGGRAEEKQGRRETWGMEWMGWVPLGSDYRG
ncbi:hypothetical protein PVAP13_3NG085202 [Panicum virgatum]|uniref:Uncharacterized protein n=1 Tax=Panicum virgatum TaxID=38727 RepID=A0A8T0UG73_PANVG|nr:hypothetical protein PVAP13_3NG085202 [Panicum virgatum]